MPIYNAVLSAIDAKETRRYAGLREAKNFDEEKIVAACHEALLLIEPRGVWREYAYDHCAQNIIGDENIHIGGKSVGRHLAGCERVIMLAVTVGEPIEKEISAKFSRGEYASAVLLDAAATAAAEQTADETEKALRRQTQAQGFLMRRRFSPGYGDWQLTEQENVVRLCGAQEIGITLSSSLMLIPRKSVTAIIGLYRNNSNEPAVSFKRTCTECPRLDCPSRV